MRGDLWGWFAGRLCNKLVAPASRFGRDRVVNDFGIDVELTDPARNQLRILGPEVNDEDSLKSTGRGRNHDQLYSRGFRL